MAVQHRLQEGGRLDGSFHQGVGLAVSHGGGGVQGVVVHFRRGDAFRAGLFQGFGQFLVGRPGNGQMLGADLPGAGKDFIIAFHMAPLRFACRVYPDGLLACNCPGDALAQGGHLVPSGIHLDRGEKPDAPANPFHEHFRPCQPADQEHAVQLAADRRRQGADVFGHAIGHCLVHQSGVGVAAANPLLDLRGRRWCPSGSSGRPGA